MAERSGGPPRKAAVGASSSGRSSSGTGGTPTSITANGGTTSSSTPAGTPTGTTTPKGGPRFPRARYNLVVVLAMALLLLFQQSRSMISIQLHFASVDDRRATQRTSSTWEPVAAMPPLPEPFHNGGIIFFLHMPKCGGTTIREYLKVHSDQLHIARHSGGWRFMIQKMDELVEHGTNGQLIAFETHDQNVPPYTQTLAQSTGMETKSGGEQCTFFRCHIVAGIRLDADQCLQLLLPRTVEETGQ